MVTDVDPFSFRAFTVKPLTPLSDHSQITVYLKRTETNTSTHTQSSKLFKLPQSYRWAENSKEHFQKAIGTPKIQTLLDTFLETTYTHSKEGINQAVKNINYIFGKTAKISELKISRNKQIKNKDDNWFDTECQNIRKQLRKLSNQKHRDALNPDLRLSYCETLKHYKRTLRTKKALYTQKQLTLIEESLNTNTFWENWKTLNKSKPEELAIQNGDVWTGHFKTLYKTIHLNTESEQNHIQEKLQSLELAIKDNQNPLDSPITGQELLEKLQVLKPRKASGPDGILNEMLKNTTVKFQQAILKLLNLVLSVGYFPDIWNQGLITPIFKSGDKLDPNNYRGICVNSNLGKVLCSIMNTRFIDFLNEHNVLSKSQIGFLPKHRTADHIYTLHTLIDKYVNQNKTKIFACFIDFQKAFDSIWHIGLFYKLLESGVGGKTYDIVKSMYTGNKCGIKIGNQRTDFFIQERGVRQGCNLSPTLFNIYINELATMLEQSSVPGLMLQDKEVKLLLYADDLVLLSPTAQGLQQGLDLLEKYRQTWALTVNMKKSKIMIFQKRSRSQGNTYKFRIGTNHIEHCTNYNYLGLNIKCSGNFNLAINELKEKARRAFYAIKKKVSIEIPIRIWLKILESIIEPIALYGSEVWGPLSKQDFAQWDKHPTETLHAEFCKNILRVQRKTVNNACRAELGQYPLLIKIQKRAIKFWKHLKNSDPHSYHYKALQCQELSPQKSPLTQLVLRLSSLTPNNTIQPQDSCIPLEPIRINQIMKQQKLNYTNYWNIQTQNQNKLECYLALKRQYTVADYLTTVKNDKLRKTLTKYRLSEHSLAIETGRHRQTWLPREERLCSHCDKQEIETELHFLIQCDKYQLIRELFFPKFIQIYPNFPAIPDTEKLQILLGEERSCAKMAAQYVAACHSLRDSGDPQQNYLYVCV